MTRPVFIFVFADTPNSVLWKHRRFDFWRGIEKQGSPIDETDVFGNRRQEITALEALLARARGAKTAGIDTFRPVFSQRGKNKKREEKTEASENKA